MPTMMRIELETYADRARRAAAKRKKEKAEERRRKAARYKDWMLDPILMLDAKPKNVDNSD